MTRALAGDGTATGSAFGGTDLAGVTGRFGQLLHAAGVPVTPERSGRFAAAIALVAPATLAELYWAGRVTLLTEHHHVEVFDRVFAQVFGGVADPADWRGAGNSPPAVHTARRGDELDVTPGAPRRDSPPPGEDEGRRAPPMTDTTEGTSEADGPTREALLAAVGSDERLRNKDFDSLTPEELTRIRVLMSSLSLVTPPRRSRRQAGAPRGASVDLRSTLRKAHRSGGDPVALVRRRRRHRARRLVLLCDISGSMESYSRAYLQLLVSAVSGARAEAFVFATRLTHLTRSLRAPTPDLALERAGRTAPDWSGGTRIGEAIKAFNDQYGRRGMARGAVVVVLSDAWESGDPALLGQEMERLRRLAYRVIWVNPRRAHDSYRPLTGGMVAALPHVDSFLSGHSLDALDEVLAAVGYSPKASM